MSSKRGEEVISWIPGGSLEVDVCITFVVAMSLLAMHPVVVDAGQVTTRNPPFKPMSWRLRGPMDNRRTDRDLAVAGIPKEATRTALTATIVWRAPLLEGLASSMADKPSTRSAIWTGEATKLEGYGRTCCAFHQTQLTRSR